MFHFWDIKVSILKKYYNVNAQLSWCGWVELEGTCQWNVGQCIKKKKLNELMTSGVEIVLICFRIYWLTKYWRDFSIGFMIMWIYCFTHCWVEQKLVFFVLWWIHPRMLLHLVECQSFFWVSNQHLGDKVPRLAGDSDPFHTFEFVQAILDLLK